MTNPSPDLPQVETESVYSIANDQKFRDLYTREPFPNLVTHIDSIIAARVAEARQEALEEAARLCEEMVLYAAFDVAQPIRALAASQAAPAPQAVEELLGKYWELAFLEGSTGESHGSKAQVVLSAIRRQFDRQADELHAGRWGYIERKHVMGASYGGALSINVMVNQDDYAMGGACYAIDCQVEREAGRAQPKEPPCAG